LRRFHIIIMLFLPIYRARHASPSAAVAFCRFRHALPVADAPPACPPFVACYFA